MKRFILSLTLLAGAALASNVLLYNPNSTPVPGRVVSYLQSVDTGLYQGASNVLINPVMPTNKLDSLKVSNGVVVVLSQLDLDRITATNAANEAIALAAFRAELRQELLAIYETPTQDTEAHRAAIQIGFRVMAEQMINLINVERVQHSRAVITTNQVWATLKTAITNAALALTP